MRYVRPRERYTKRYASLKQQRSTWEPHWKEIDEHIAPGRYRANSSDVNNGAKKYGSILNARPQLALRVTQSGMMSGITSPSRPWFRFTVDDPLLAENTGVRSWLHKVEALIRLILIKSNVYQTLHNVYGDLGAFGVSALYVEDDPLDLVRGYVFPLGRYALANSPRLLVDTIYREVTLSVHQAVRQFQLENVSGRVKLAYENGNYEEPVEILHAIEPNEDLQHDKAGPAGMRWKSCWMELGVSSPGDKEFLRESGYEEFPVMCPRWEVTGEDTYGRSPGMLALGDCKGLQRKERRKLQALDKIINPPMVGPISLQGQRASLLPGDTTYVDEAKGGQTFRPAIDISPMALQMADASTRIDEERINAIFYADLWLMIAQNERTVTAREVAEKHEEKMLQLGPVLERLQGELLRPLIDRVFAILLRRNMLPEAPPELAGRELGVEYTSVVAQAQRLLTNAPGLERLASFVGGLAQINPEAVDKFDMDEAIDTYAEVLGVNPDVVRSDDVVAQMREARTQQREAEAQAQQMAAASQSAKTLSETKLEDDSALSRMVSTFGGVPGQA